MACNEEPPHDTMLQSPDKKLEVQCKLSPAGQPFYTASYEGKTILDTSLLGFILKDQDDLVGGFEIKHTAISSKDESWQQPWGEVKTVRDHHNQLAVDLQEMKGKKRKLRLVFRAFDDGFAFRYEFPEQENLEDFVIMSELTQFRMTGDHTCWWIPANYDSYEHLYTESPISEIDASPYVDAALAQVSTPVMNATHTPLTMRSADGLYLSIHEADLTDYASMTLRSEPGNLLECDLVPWADGSKVKVKAPFVTPWRTVQVAKKPGQLVESTMILNLNDPNQLGDVSWIKPMKYVGIWWRMHLGKWTWDEGPRDGATTANAKAYIDFAAENGMKGVLVEGWNRGWDRKEPFSYTESCGDFDIEAVARYGKEKGVAIVGHHETYGNLSNYEQQLDSAMAFYASLSVPAVKTGYVGRLLPEKEYHHSQWFVRHFQKVIEKAAEHKICIVAHEPIKATGKRRTFPNMLAREGLRGSEFNSPWGGGNPPEHLTIIPFTRMLGGPIDYTPGLFKLDLNEFREERQVPTTLAYQLAEYIVIYGPVQMASDLPEHYARYPDALAFIREVAVDWEKSIVLDGEIGDYIVVARKEREGERWFVGALSDEHSREIMVDLSFLDEGKSYRADIYHDAADAHYLENAEAYEIEKSRAVTAGDTLELKLAPGGGAAVIIGL
jgi:alpha-glucosidase